MPRASCSARACPSSGAKPEAVPGKSHPRRGASTAWPRRAAVLGSGYGGLRRRLSRSRKQGRPACSRPGEHVQRAGGEQGPAGTHPPCKQPHGPPRPVPSLRSAGGRLPAAPPCRAGLAPSARASVVRRGGPRVLRSRRRLGGGRQAPHRPEKPPARPGPSSASPGAAAAARPCPCRPPAPGSSYACSSSSPPCPPPTGGTPRCQGGWVSTAAPGRPGLRYLSALFLLLFLLLRGGPALLICRGEAASVPRPEARPALGLAGNSSLG